MKKIMFLGLVLMFTLPMLFNNCFGGVKIKSPVEKYKLINDTQLVIADDTLRFDYVEYQMDCKNVVDTFIYINNEFRELLRDEWGYYYGDKNYHYSYYCSNKFQMDITTTPCLIIVEIIHNNRQYIYRVFENEDGTIDRGCINAIYSKDLAYYVIDVNDIDSYLIRFYNTNGDMIYYADVIEVGNQDIYANNFR